MGTGSVGKSPDQAAYDYGTVVQLTATAGAGWHFIGWSGDASGTANPVPVTMDADKSVTATFAKNTIVVSQVYGGGGNAGSTYTNDFVELFNRGPRPDRRHRLERAVRLGGRHARWATTALSGVILPGHYYLVQESAGTGGTTPLPTPDASGGITMSATAGKIAL